MRWLPGPECHCDNRGAEVLWMTTKRGRQSVKTNVPTYCRKASDRKPFATIPFHVGMPIPLQAAVAEGTQQAGMQQRFSIELNAPFSAQQTTSRLLAARHQRFRYCILSRAGRLST